MYMLQLKLPDEVGQSLLRAASEAGQTPQEMAVIILRQHLGKRDERLRRHFGAINLGAPTGTNNESIDADLAQAYVDSH